MGTEPPAAQPRRSVLGWLGVALRGAAMGVAELVPGVSGGTIAFISGIYAELLYSLRSLPQAGLLLVRGQLAGAWQAANANFLLALVIGMAATVISLAKVLRGLLETDPLLVWGFFFGLILASIPLVARATGRWGLAVGLAGGTGLALGLVVTVVNPVALPDTPLAVFAAGVVAVSAWLMPGVSGSFLLLLMGMYQPMVSAIADGDAGFLLALGAGMATGLLLFARLLSWLLHRFRAVTLALLTGFMAGSLHKLWPWQEVLSYQFREGPDGGSAVPLLTRPVTPAQFHELSGQDPQVLGAVLAMLVGVAVVFGLEYAGRRSGAPPLGAADARPAG